jgi:hypothetical protein
MFRIVPETGVGCQRWFLTIKGIIKENEIPAKWGLLEVTEKKRIKVIKNAELQDSDYRNEINMLVSMIRRLNTVPDNHVAIKKYKPLK